MSVKTVSPEETAAGLTMARARGPFRQSDLTRAMPAAVAAGTQVSGIEIDPPTGEITIVAVVEGAGAAIDSSADLDHIGSRYAHFSRRRIALTREANAAWRRECEAPQPTTEVGA